MIWFLIIPAFYGVIMLLFFFGNVTRSRFVSNKQIPLTRFSVVIPFRNEAENLPRLLNSLSALQYPKELFEIIFIDDDSTDTSEEIVAQWMANSAQDLNIRCIKNIRKTASPKKDAINTAIAIATHDWIITTDADCVINPLWLQTYDAFIQKTDALFVAAPVDYIPCDGFIHHYQTFDNWSLQGITAASFALDHPLLCNGANMAYKKEAFHQVGGFDGNQHIASGDDIFLLEKMVRTFPKQVKYLKSNDAIVTTKTEISWKSVISQRVRWASKTSKQRSWLNKILGVLVFVMNLYVLLFPLALCFGRNTFLWMIGIVIFKMFIDSLIIGQSAGFFRRKINLLSFFRSFIAYAIITTIVVFRSLFTTYQWKGRMHHH